jgi:hypothetical protein
MKPNQVAGLGAVVFASTWFFCLVAVHVLHIPQRFGGQAAVALMVVGMYSVLMAAVFGAVAAVLWLIGRMWRPMG